MSEGMAGEITLLLQAAKTGQPGAVDRLFSRVYDELRKIASNRINAIGNWAAAPTTVVNEVYLRLFKKVNPSWEDRRHFFWAASRAMRDILVERARRDQAVRHGGGKKRLELHEDMAATSGAPDLMDLNEALNQLEILHPIPYKVVDLKFFGGLNRDQIAEILDISPSAVWREWCFARAWLLQRIGDKDIGGE